MMDDQALSESGSVKAMKRARAGKKVKSTLREYAEAILVAVVLTFIIRTFVMQAFRIPTGSMEDTLLVGDYLFVNKFLYGARVPFTDITLPEVRDPARGDIIVFKFPADPSRDFIKRLVGAPGDTIQIRSKVVYVNGEPVEEPYVKLANTRMRREGMQQPNIYPPGAGNADYYGPVVVPPDHYFMMGDNRDNSDDSRFWGFLPRELIKGKAIFIYFSWDKTKMRPRVTRVGRLIH
jgi:signal peptidase I